jgi:hypothetical protein
MADVLGGTIIRKDDGSWYYIRDDKLDAFLVTDDETLTALNSIGGESDVEGFAMIPAGPASFELRQPLNIGFNNLALRARGGLGIGSC